MGLATDKVQTATIPLPIGGMNRRDSAIALSPEDSPLIAEYYCYPSALRSRGKLTSGVTLGTIPKRLFNWYENAVSSYTERVIATSDTKIYSIDSSWAVTDISAGTITNGEWSAIPFANYLIMANGVDPVKKISVADVVTAAAFVGPGGADTALNQVWSYRGKIYFVQNNSQIFWYHATLAAITGALVSVDVSNFFNTPGKLLFGTSWSYNQGSTNQDYNVLVNADGEVLIYQGTDPGASDYSLIGRTKIPRPLSKNSFRKVGTDLIVYTTSGAVALSAALANVATSSSLATVTDKIARIFERGYYPVAADANASRTASSAMIVEDILEPFLYMLGGNDPVAASYFNYPVWVMNTKTGAWSQFELPSDFANPETTPPISMVHAFGYLVLGYHDKTVKYLSKATADSGYKTIKTAWSNLGSDNIKQIVAVRILWAATNVAATNIEPYKLRIWADLEQDPAATTDKIAEVDFTNQGGNQTLEVIRDLEVEIGIIGKWFQIELYTNGTFTCIDEIYGFEVQYKSGGLSGELYV